MNIKNTHTIIIGGKGCGKSEYTRKQLGLTPQQYREECENFDQLVSEQQKQKSQNDELFKSIMMSYYEELNIY